MDVYFFDLYFFGYYFYYCFWFNFEFVERFFFIIDYNIWFVEGSGLSYGKCM